MESANTIFEKLNTVNSSKLILDEATVAYQDIHFEVRTIHDLRFTLEGEDELTTGETTSAEFILHVTNHGNIVETVQILTSDSLRGWTVNVIEDEFELSPGNSRTIIVRVTPPAGMVQDDTYRFTITVQPKGMPVAGEPLDLEVTAEVSSGLSWLSEDNEQILRYVTSAYAQLIIIFLKIKAK